MRRALPRHMGRVAFACAMVLLASAQAFAYELRIEQPFERTGTVWANVRLEDLIQDGDISANVPMAPGDIIIIPEAWF